MRVEACHGFGRSNSGHEVTDLSGHLGLGFGRVLLLGRGYGVNKSGASSGKIRVFGMREGWGADFGFLGVEFGMGMGGFSRAMWDVYLHLLWNSIPKQGGKP
jgi:hypothetical protein